MKHTLDLRRQLHLFDITRTIRSLKAAYIKQTVLCVFVQEL
jgi:hypothetical protein